MESAPPTIVLNTLLQRFASEAQSLVLIFRAALSGLPDPTATAIRPPRPLRAQWETFLLMHSSLRTALGVQSRRNEEVETFLNQIGALIRELTLAGPGAQRTEETKKGLDARFSQAVLGLLQAEKGEVTERLASFGVVQPQHLQMGAVGQGSGFGVVQTTARSPPPSGPLPQAPTLGSMKSVGASGSFAEITRPTSQLPPPPPSISLPTSKSKTFEPSKSKTFEGSTENLPSQAHPLERSPSAISPHAAALEDKIRQLDQLSRRAPSPSPPATTRPDPSREPLPAPKIETPPPPTTAPPPIPCLSKKPVRGSVPSIALPPLPTAPSVTIPVRGITQSDSDDAPYSPSDAGLSPFLPEPVAPQPQTHLALPATKLSPHKSLDALAAELDAFASSVDGDSESGSRRESLTGAGAPQNASSLMESAIDLLQKSSREQPLTETAIVGQVATVAPTALPSLILGHTDSIPTRGEEKGTIPHPLPDTSALEKAEAAQLCQIIDGQKSTTVMESTDEVVNRLSREVA
ncbi:hypothetical protein HK097_005424, partial [Rhizophlyctis rosea]